MSSDAKFMVFDVESVGLHGEGFAVGWVVIDKAGKRIAEAIYSCKSDAARGTNESREWVSENVPPISVTHKSPKEMRSHFWADWLRWKANGAVLAADVAWPVEAGFLSDCIEDARRTIRGGVAAGDRDWEGPYPLIDISSIRFAAGFDPLAPAARADDERPNHNPLCDARQSARLLIEALDRKGGAT